MIHESVNQSINQSRINKKLFQSQKQPPNKIDNTDYMIDNHAISTKQKVITESKGLLY